MDALGFVDFLRIRIGIGRPPAGSDPARYVLGNFSLAEQNHLRNITIPKLAQVLAEQIWMWGVYWSHARCRFPPSRVPGHSHDRSP